MQTKKRKKAIEEQLEADEKQKRKSLYLTLLDIVTVCSSITVKNDQVKKDK